MTKTYSLTPNKNQFRARSLKELDYEKSIN